MNLQVVSVRPRPTDERHRCHACLNDVPKNIEKSWAELWREIIDESRRLWVSDIPISLLHISAEKGVKNVSCCIHRYERERSKDGEDI